MRKAMSHRGPNNQINLRMDCTAVEGVYAPRAAVQA